MRRFLILLLAFQFIGLPALVSALTPRTVSWCQIENDWCNRQHSVEQKTTSSFAQNAEFCSCDENNGTENSLHSEHLNIPDAQQSDTSPEIIVTYLSLKLKQLSITTLDLFDIPS